MFGLIKEINYEEKQRDRKNEIYLKRENKHKYSDSLYDIGL